jgi:hypothetical protein
MFECTKVCKSSKLYNEEWYAMVGYGKMKISISITQEEAQFLSRMVATGQAASISHAVRLAIHALEVEQ